MAHDRRKEFEEVALPHLDSLYGMAMALARNRADAEELVQETYLRAYRAFDQFAPGTNCRAWLFTILHHHFLNRVKKSSREILGWDSAETDLGEDRVNPPAAETPESEFFQRIRDVEVRQALEDLPVLFREVVRLADLEGFSYREIATIIGRPEGTVMSRLHRGRHLLRRALMGFAREHGYLHRGP